MRKILTVSIVLAGLVFSSTAFAQNQSSQNNISSETAPEQRIENTIQSIDPLPAEEETTESENPEGGIPDTMESHPYGFHNSGCPEGQSLYQVGTQDFSTIFFETVTQSCALFGLRLETLVRCPHTAAWARSTNLATGITTAPVRLHFNGPCVPVNGPAPEPAPVIPPPAQEPAPAPPESSPGTSTPVPTP